MKKIVLLMVVCCLAVGMMGQKVHRTNVMFSAALGSIRLVEIDKYYSIQLESGNQYHPYVTVMLGDSVNAARLLEFIGDLYIEGEDVVDLENASNNSMVRGPLGSFRVFDETRVFTGTMHRTHARSMWEALTGEKYKKKKKEKRTPAYMKNYEKE